MNMRELNIRDLDKPLKFLRIFLIIQAVFLIVVNTLFGHLDGLVYIFVIFVAICLFCQINMRSTYQFLIVLTILLCFFQAIHLLYYLFYRSEDKKKQNPALQIVISGLAIFVLLTTVLIIWRHYQKKQLENYLAGIDGQQILSQF